MQPPASHRLQAGQSHAPRAPPRTLTLEHGGQLPHAQAPDGRVLAQGALQQEERDPREDERQEVGDEEGPCGWRGRGSGPQALGNPAQWQREVVGSRPGFP